MPDSPKPEAASAEPKDIVFVEIGTPTLNPNWLVNCSILADGIAITLATRRVGVGDNGKLELQAPITVRLQLDLNMAKLVRDAIDLHLQMLAAPEGKPN